MAYYSSMPYRSFQRYLSRESTMEYLNLFFRKCLFTAENDEYSVYELF